MNILFLMGTYPSYGGVEKVTTVLSNCFVKKGHAVSIVSFEQPCMEIAENELDSTVRLYKLEKPVSDKKNIRELHRIIVDRDIDFLISQWAVPFYVARLCREAMRNTKCKLISVHHNVPDMNAQIMKIKQDIENHNGSKLLNKIKLGLVRTISRLSLRSVYNKSDRYVVLSKSFKEIAKNYMWLRDCSKMISLPNPVTTDGHFNKDLKENEILYVGRIENNQKRCFRLLEIWRELYHCYPDWRLTIVGDGPDRKIIENRINELNLKNIYITGFTDPKPYYERAKLLLLVSDFEGLPLVITEGMSYGVIPIVLNSFASCRDLITDGISGSIVNEPFDSEIFNKVVKQYLDSPELLAYTSEKAEELSRNFSLPKVALQWEKLFESLLLNS